jgi:glucose-6-phosphate 1-dehydrogenase
MEPPSSLEPEDIRDRKVEVLRALRCPDVEELARFVVRARYGPGELDGEQVLGYAQEEGVPAGSTTETYVAMRAEIGTWRWSGVPFLLRHGKRLPHKRTEVQVQFRTPPIQLFNRPEGLSEAEFRRKLRDGSMCQIRPNVLTLGIQPREEIRLTFGVKRPGSEMIMSPAGLAFDYREHFGQETPDAYERLLLDALQGDATLFLRADEVEASWRYADEVRAGWKAVRAPVLEYPAGSWGPPEADELFQGCEGAWSRG